jgi:hypothetical protein
MSTLLKIVCFGMESLVWSHPQTDYGALLDDGITQSISQLEIMGAIMDQVRRIRYPDKPDEVVLPCQFVTIIGGTGTGGCVLALTPREHKMTSIRLIAIMLTRLKMSVAEAITELRIIIDEVYANKLEPADKTKKLRDCIERLLTKRNLAIDLKLGDGRRETSSGIGYIFPFPLTQELAINGLTDWL